MAQQVVTFHYDLKDKDNALVDSSRGEKPLTILEGAGQIISGLETVLMASQKGDIKDVLIPYQDAYGPYDQMLVSQVPRDQFPPQPIKTGDMFQIQREGTPRVITVIDVTDAIITIDANHPMAGKDLNFHIEIIGRRDATPEEIEHGHVH